MSQPTCPNCDSVVSIAGKPKLYQNVTCKKCGEKLEVIDLNPVELDFVEPDYEDYDDEDDDYDED